MAREKDSDPNLWWLAGLFAVAGLGILIPGFKDAALSFLNRTFDLHLALDQPAWWGWVLVVLGIVLVLLAFFGRNATVGGLRHLAGRTATITGNLIVVRHTGFVPPVRTPEAGELPAGLRRRELIDFPIDLGRKLAGADLEGALADQMARTVELEAGRTLHRRADLAYAGIIQAPFQLLAGLTLSRWGRIYQLEWDRHRSAWLPLLEDDGQALNLQQTVERVGQGGDIAVAVELSYPIATAEIVASVPGVREVRRLSLPQPRLDAITHVGQLAALGKAFRGLLDELKRQAPAGTRIHLFYAGPVSAGLRLGQQLNTTLDLPVTAYAYGHNSQPPYPWGISLTGAAGPSIVRT